MQAVIWDAFMVNGELDMLDCRMEAFAGARVCHVAVESRHTHRGVPKPLHLAGAMSRYARYPLRRVVDDWAPDADPWNMEHHQRNAAWKIIDAEAADGDVVMICDVDEIPGADLLEFAAGRGDAGVPASAWLRTFLFAVDWEVGVPVPPACVIAPVRYLRQQAAYGRYLAEVRDLRDYYPLARGGGWHFSWVGGPQAQRAKLETATCHTEILGRPEADLIRSGARWRSAENGGGLPVVPVDVDQTWPAYVCERRCPPSWFRPRSEEEEVA